MDKINLANIRQSFGNSVYNWKIHEVSSEKLHTKLFIVKIINIILVSLVVILLGAQALSNSNFFNTYKNIFDFFTIFLSVVEIIFLIILLSFGFEEKAGQHKKTALNFRAIRDKYINLITDIVNESIEEKDIIERRNALLSEFQTICNLAPPTSRRSYVITRNRLKPFSKSGMLKALFLFIKNSFVGKVISEEDFTLSDKEIDMFLPEALKINKIN